MTGLDTFNDQIIEIATVVTDANLNLLAQGPMLAIHQHRRWSSREDISSSRGRQDARRTPAKAAQLAL